jgi:pentalenene oxygenase
VLGGRAARYDDLPRLDLTTRIVTETLRLYPPGWLMTRATTARVDLGGHRIPAGATVIYSPYLAGRRVTDFPGPDRFDPDRWPATSPARGTFVPFGGGARKCIGDTFAVTQASLAVATIAARWRLHAVPGIRTDPVARAVLAPRPLPMLIRRRMVATPRQNDGDGHATSS